MLSFKPPSPPYIGPPAHSSGNGNKPIHRVVIHSTVSPCVRGGARSIAKYFQSRSAGGSAQYVTDPYETIQAGYDDLVCWHAPPNPHTLGIEMCDIPGPVPGDGATKAAIKAARRAWRWRRPEQVLMLKRTATLTAQLCLAYDIPPRFLSAAMLRKEGVNAKGITTHNETSSAFKQSRHWDPGFWPKKRFMSMVRSEINRLKLEASR